MAAWHVRVGTTECRVVFGLRALRPPRFVFIIGSIRPYLEAACKWYSEADAGPGAEASRASASVITRIILAQYVLQHRCGRVQAEFTSTRRWALALRPEHHPRSDQSVGHVEQPVS